MRIYLDDDSCDHVLVALLRKAGHDVVIPAEVSLSGRRDPEHFLWAIQEKRAVLTKNYKDFVPLHALVLGSGGKHAGLFIVRMDNDLRKDLTPQGVVSAINNVVQVQSDLANVLTYLNDWR